MPDLLIELFSEEIPARMQARAREDLKKLVTDGLVEAGLTYASAGAFSTPRRLVLSVEGLSAESPTLREERKGPKADAPAAAIEGFLRSTGLTRDQLETREDKKGAVLFAVVEKPGRPAPEIVAEVLERTIRTFPWPKSMRWGTGSLRWVRPLQSILCLLSDEAGAEVVPMTLDGLTAGNSTEGHRFMAPARFAVSGFEDYRAKLARAFVMLDASEREQAIWHEATTQAFAQGLEVVPDAALLSEVAGLVEWPVVLMGAIGEDFLGLPPEVLQTSMREHQKFFSVTNPATGRIEKFVTVANRETADHGETILKGNGKVLSARLSDARFFWENDLRTVKTAGLEGMAEGLKQVTFHNRLGSQAARIARIEALAREIAPLVGASPDLAAEAARVAKADLQSAMVGEFPELQGTMGSYYARAAGLPEAVAQACKAHYQPLGPSDAVPTDPVSVAVALADKIDTLAGFWRIGEKPTGSKDPFALRRAALGVIRLLLTNNSRAGLMGIMLPAMNRHLEPFDTSDFTPYERDLLAFFHDRLKVHLREQGIRHDVIDACLAMPGNDDLTLLVKRAEALSAFLKTDDGTNLLQGFKRANNILTQAEAKDGVEYSFGADPKFAETDAERALFAALETAEAAIGPALQAEDFAAAMSAMAALRAPIDAFFETVQVNADNAVLRRNRLNMLHSIRATCARVADLTRIEG
ncbi:glycine--tRNA ligase subunit beta [Rhodobacter sphaeroides]|jgi:glycyl-tRNA synthetase beta chain (EC 6.1.1.14)|uniref:Glycine--tRNA ligase beta subunit n=2 Tax=Cereibacter sphaeroides TaxID=1063 RepID=SYGB_CERS4|nr:glycine--tRNA ligase subunit beta [Cereibacter sphaeroides]Q3J5C7.1 RecName: Full=Glycine--tRNA ligase beta subunit; AltName: Full=Glycyl-tRNA synthetase beta subunit; Short=GlyRS [Cereibacter sphaeroides 2.4.1]ABA78007.1 glycyl-tRNA synthetase beta chain [Cereibacter sphaeroides 2.4.1]AMJ46387.1 glycine--tRNA ligase subunit beta [Cereibacter sphaeroides]ANS33098.1 glycine--tRNA ligase subunit beta [Cereibacter sphaeroides]ATN62150.1 glycine--tRNA ligase subunit beta [Cereibacter sphaeroide